MKRTMEKPNIIMFINDWLKESHTIAIISDRSELLFVTYLQPIYGLFITYHNKLSLLLDRVFTIVK